MFAIIAAAVVALDQPADNSKTIKGSFSDNSANFHCRVSQSAAREQRFSPDQEFSFLLEETLPDLWSIRLRAAKLPATAESTAVGVLAVVVGAIRPSVFSDEHGM